MYLRIGEVSMNQGDILFCPWEQCRCHYPLEQTMLITGLTCHVRCVRILVACQIICIWCYNSRQRRLAHLTGCCLGNNEQPCTHSCIVRSVESFRNVGDRLVLWWRSCAFVRKRGDIVHCHGERHRCNYPLGETMSTAFDQCLLIVIICVIIKL